MTHDLPLFGESLPADPFTRLQAELDLGFDLGIAVGLATPCPYLARPLLLAKQDGIPTVEIAIGSSELPDAVDFVFKGSPMKILAADLRSFLSALVAPARRMTFESSKYDVALSESDW